MHIVALVNLFVDTASCGLVSLDNIFDQFFQCITPPFHKSATEKHGWITVDKR